MPASALQNGNGSLFEHRLIHNVIDADRLEARMAEACLTRASREELRKACRNMVESRTTEIQQLEKWSSLWYSTTIAEHNDIKKDPRMKKLAGAKRATFDSVFVIQAIAQQDQVLSILAGCEDSAWHDVLKQLCHEVRKSRLEQKQTFQAWLSDWFRSSESGVVRKDRTRIACIHRPEQTRCIEYADQCEGVDAKL